MDEIEEVRKNEVEQLLGFGISDTQFEEAMEHARRKQSFLHGLEKRDVIMEHWYLVKLTEEYVRSLAFSKLTLDLCRKNLNMEKEHLTHSCFGALTDNHIVPPLAL